MRHTGHIRERSPGAFELRYALGTDPATGVRKTATTTVRGTRKDAEKELRRLLRAIDEGQHVDPHRMTVKQWLRTWLDSVKQEVSPKTWERYEQIVDKYLVAKLGNLLLVKLAPTHVQAAYNELATDPRRDGKPGALSPRTRQHIHRVLSGALNRAVEQQLISRNPVEVFRRRLPKVERKELAVLTPVQAARLLAAIRHSHIYWPAMLALATGVRRGEVLAIRWRNIDLDRGVVRIVESLEQTRAGLRFKSPKTERGRAVTLPAFATEELRQLKKEQAEALLKLGVRQTGDSLVCARQDGLPLQPQSLTHEFQRFIVKLPDLPRVRFHDLRHSHATQLLAAGVHPKIAQERLGHSTISTTLDLYSHASETMQEDAAQRLDAALGGAIRGRRDAS